MLFYKKLQKFLAEWNWFGEESEISSCKPKGSQSSWKNKERQVVTSQLEMVRQDELVLVCQFSFSVYEAGYCCCTENCLNVPMNCFGLDYSGEATAPFPSL